MTRVERFNAAMEDTWAFVRAHPKFFTFLAVFIAGGVFFKLIF